MKQIDNTINLPEQEILASLKGEILDEVLVTVSPPETGDEEQSAFSLTDVLLRTRNREVLLHLAERTDTVTTTSDIYTLEITSNPLLSTNSALAGEHDENGNELPGWYGIPVGKTIREVIAYTDENSCTVKKDGEAIPVRDTGVIAVSFSDSCLVLAKVAFMDNWRVFFQESPVPDVTGLLNTP